MRFRLMLSVSCLFLGVLPLRAELLETSVPPADGAKYKSADFRVWLPDGVKTIRGVIVRQHGCGRNGIGQAEDVQWQALAKKWDCALLGTHFVQDKECADWFDPANGSEKAFFTAIKTFAAKSGHAELAEAPWAIWGHSGGALWAMHMANRHPRRVIGVFARSQALTFAEPDALHIPVIFNYGAREMKGRFEKVHLNTAEVLAKYRPQGALWAASIDPKAEHDCRFSRQLAAPFFDAVLEQRLPPVGQARLRPVDTAKAWLANPDTLEIAPLEKYAGDKAKAAWLINESVARAWQEFAKTGEVADKTPPAAPSKASAVRTGDVVKLDWSAEADLRSGIRFFHVYRDGAKIATVGSPVTKANPKGHYQIANYGDEPEPRPSPMLHVDKSPTPNAVYAITVENHAGLESARAAVMTKSP